MITRIRRYLLEGDLQTALQKYAESIGERARHAELQKHWTAERERIDPMEDHWGFATARDHELSHQQKWVDEGYMLHKYNQRIADLKRKLTPLPKAATKRPWCLFLRRRIVEA